MHPTRQAYLNHPNTCEHCKDEILPKEHETITVVKKKRFCSQACFNSSRQPLLNKLPRNHKKTAKYFGECANCGGQRHPQSNQCKQCYRETLADRAYKGFSHSAIRSHARGIAQPKGKACEWCGYSKFVEVCHIKPIKSFPSTATLLEINCPENLKILCPNCHWELDHEI